MDAGGDERVELTQAFYERNVEREWQRLVRDVEGRVQLEVLQQFLARSLPTSPSRILEVGAGPGRFTLWLAEQGHAVEATDLSPACVAAGRANLASGGLDAHVTWSPLDLRDALGRYGPASFDAVVALGGSLAYLDDPVAAIDGLLACVVPGGPLVLSVPSLAGSYRARFDGVVGGWLSEGDAAHLRVLETGEAYGFAGNENPLRMFRLTEVTAWAEAVGATITDLSASCFAAAGSPACLDPVAADPSRWAIFLDTEVAMARQPGCVEAGTHIVATLRRSS